MIVVTMVNRHIQKKAKVRLTAKADRRIFFIYTFN